MRLSLSSLAVLGLLNVASADLHQLIVGTFKTESLYTLEFDDAALTLELIGNFSANAASSWIALSHDKKNLYGTSFTAATPSFVSYTLASATDIIYNTTLEIGCNSSAVSIFAIASSEPPYAVYGCPFVGASNCGAVMSVDENGVLSEVIQDYSYNTSSGVHGMAFDSANDFLYSADDSGNALWTHSVDNTTGELTFVSSVAGPVTGADPRHVTVHPEGQYLYVVLEGANELAQYSIDTTTGIPFFENVTYPLIPSGSANADYWSDEVALSFSNNYLWATSRARNTTNTGYISAFSLSSNGSIATQLFLTPTSSSGGQANAVAPSTFSDEFVALTDSATGFVEVWKLGAENASAVARVDIVDGGCCANAVWYS
ncbi:Carboxy-cis,cis-muconate cyclase [Lachnellula suecica]|uniref:Carboxy-cis,cis-muconate cyclase n=1 Tax=Lachnellula suecica TaxID=602035 RepID=A0A8T9C1R7_9HELO|nr:Carboxy-cis,cis-muconate cyclase [Lachnellula suecica]